MLVCRKLAELVEVAVPLSLDVYQIEIVIANAARPSIENLQQANVDGCMGELPSGELREHSARFGPLSEATRHLH